MPSNPKVLHNIHILIVLLKKVRRIHYYHAMNLFVRGHFCHYIINNKFDFQYLFYVKNKTAKPEGKFGDERHSNMCKPPPC